MRIPRLSLAALALLTSTGTALAGGFQVNLAAQKNIGMGHVGTGLALDQGSIFFNPGALAFVRERGVTIGAAATIARTAFRDDATGQDFSFKHSTATPAQLYAAFGPKGADGKPGKWAAGIGIYTPFGATLDYGSGWTGRYSLTKISLLSGFIQPTFSYQITDWLGVGAGFVYGLGYVDLRKDIPITNQQGTNANIKLESDNAATGTGFNAGIYLKPTEMLSIGISYRSKVDMKVKGGKVTINNIPGAAPLQAAFAAKKFDATLPLPATTSIGIGLTPTEKLTVAADFNFTQWSAYKSLDFDFDGTVGGSTTSTSVRKYKDSFAVRLGGQYRVIDALTVRLGGYYDKTPVRDGYITPETPDANRLAGTAGASIHAGEHVDIDFAYEFLAFKKRSQTQEELVANGTTDRVAGTYQTYISVVGLGVNYKF
jgi:long-chain fatty acid transport protein